MKEVLVILLTNAIKFGAGKPITIRLQSTDSFADLSVRDHGIGIAQKDQEKIFERYGRAVSSRHFGGFGINLFIAREIVKAHHGSISVQSRPGEGTIFTVRVPLFPYRQGGRARVEGILAGHRWR
jgi:signal transduction histidine kinase